MRPLLALMTLLTAAIAPAQEALRPDDLARFDGQTWSGIRLGIDTDGEIKRRFRWERGPIRPEAVRLTVENPAIVRVDALLDGRGAKAAVRAIYVEFGARGPSLDDLRRDLGPSESGYARPRYEEWRIEAFAERGIVVLVTGEGNQERVESAILTAPARVPALLRDFSARPQPIEPAPDPGERWDRVVEFSTAYANVSWSNRDTPRELGDNAERDLKEDIEDELRGLGGRRSSLAYSRRGSGSISLTVTSGRWNDRGEASFTVTASVTSGTPYGQFAVAVSETQTIRRDYRWSIRRLAREAIDELERQVDRDVRALRPRPAESYRDETWKALMASASSR